MCVLGNCLGVHDRAGSSHPLYLQTTDWPLFLVPAHQLLGMYTPRPGFHPEILGWSVDVCLPTIHRDR